jgi:phosphatidate cytidylyltransferase
MLKQRITTALVLLAIVVPAIAGAQPWVWGLISLLMLSIAGREWGRLLGSRSGSWLLCAALAVCGAIYLLWRTTTGIGALPGEVVGLSAASLAFWLSVGLISLVRGHPIGSGWATGLLVLSACWVALFELRLVGGAMLVSAMAVVWVADIGAYFAGRTFGRHKLAPHISPGKTWEGVAGGVATVLALSMAVVLLVPQASDSVFSSRLLTQLGWPIGAAILTALACLSVTGDLYESLLKRRAGVKDSGASLPGHGGVLDRIDALIPTMPGCLLLMELLR